MADLATDVAAVEASEASMETRVAAAEKALADQVDASKAANAALQAEIDALKAAGDTTGLAARLEAVQAKLDTFNAPPAPAPTPAT